VEVRVATYNVRRCIGRDGRQDPVRCFQVIQELNASVVGLQEVDGNLTTGAGQELLVLARGNGYAVHHGITLRRPDADYGNALLTRGRILNVDLHDISVPGAEPRGVIAASFLAGDVPFRVLVTHFGLRFGERCIQARRVGSLAAEDDGGVTVVLGDFNDWRPRTASLRPLRDVLGPAPAPRSYPAHRPLLRLDRVWVRPRERLLRVEAHRTAAARLASDHLPVLAHIDLDPGPGNHSNKSGFLSVSRDGQGKERERRG
jgi:endonuclease/exonuclease/phosphatase family metal-dependent hydrolase